ncbi:MAG: hypothetical protein AAF558_12445 [Verrucomicrobiota bacterium]
MREKNTYATTDNWCSSRGNALGLSKELAMTTMSYSKAASMAGDSLQDLPHL